MVHSDSCVNQNSKSIKKKFRNDFTMTQAVSNMSFLRTPAIKEASRSIVGLFIFHLFLFFVKSKTWV